MTENRQKDSQIVLDLYNLRNDLRGDRCLADVPGFVLDKYNISRDIVAKVLEEAGFHCFTDDGAFYAYDRERLQGLLNQNIGDLHTAGWPTQADRFVQYMFYVEAPINTWIWDFIARCHDDNVNGGLRKNCNTMFTATQIEKQHKYAEDSRISFTNSRPDFFKKDESPTEGSSVAARKEAKTPRGKNLRAFVEKLRERFSRYAGEKPAVAPHRDTAPVKARPTATP